MLCLDLVDMSFGHTIVFQEGTSQLLVKGLSSRWFGVLTGGPGVQIISPQANPFSSAEAVLQF